MKPLEKGRRVLNWMGIHFSDDEAVIWQLKWAQNASAVIYAILFITIFSLYAITFLELQTINPEEFFFVLLQFVMAAHGSSAFITIYLRGAYISSVFKSLTEIYEKCRLKSFN